MVDVRLLKTAMVDEERSEQARRAIKEFRALQPTLSGYARAFTGNPAVRVELSGSDNGSTDGTRIFYRPPIALGDPTPHERKLCDKRDEIGTPLCKACATRESVLVTIYHEIAHIAEGTFVQPTEDDLIEAVQRAIKEVGTKYGKEIAEKVRRNPFTSASYLGLASIVSPYLPVLVNALEDTRVNSGLFKTRKGTRRMFDADTQRIFAEGVEQKDPRTGEVMKVMWKDYKLNAQISCGVFCKASGYNYENWFDPVVVQALNDPKLTELLARLETATTASDSYELAFPVLARLRELGFCKADSDPEDEEPDKEDEPKEDGQSNGGEESSEPDGEEPGDSQGDSGSEAHADEGDGPDEADQSGGDSGSEQDASGSGEDSAAGDTGEELDTEGSEDSQDGSGSGDEHSDSELPADGDGGSQQGGSSGDPEGQESDGNQGEPVRPSDEADDSDERSQDPSESGREGGDEDVKPIDTGADKGEGGTELIIPDDADMGTAEDAMTGLMKVEQHEDLPKTMEAARDNTAMEVAVIQGLYFETPSNNVIGVRENRFGKPTDTSMVGTPNSWENSERAARNTRKFYGIDGNFDTPEELLGPALLRMRVAFTDNQRGKTTAHLKSGRVNSRILGKRAPAGDPRLFKKRTQPGKKNYFVLIMVDISGSTMGENLVLEKRAVMAQANLLSRMGIKFAIVAHSGTYIDTSMGWGRSPLELDVYLVKEPEEPWSEETKKHLRELAPFEMNLDGHALEYGRKILDKVQATEKILLYYSDGKMPAENHDEELRILQREIRVCAKKGYTLLGVGIRTDSPARHGLPTVQVDEDEDLVKVVKHLEGRLLK